MAGYVGVVGHAIDVSFLAVVAIWLAALLWIVGFVYNCIKRRRTRATIRELTEQPGLSTELVVRCKPRFPVFPGCYFYIDSPRKPGAHFFGFRNEVNGLPLALVCDTKESEGAQKERLVTFIISHAHRKSSLPLLRIEQDIVLDGPYGPDIRVTNCATMVLAAQGPGILGLLSFARHQVDQFKSKKLRHHKRRVAILWVLDHFTQQGLCGSHLQDLQNLDPDSVRSPSPLYRIS